MAYSNEVRARARNLFVHSRMTIPAISITIDVPGSTVSRWKSDAKNGGDDWDIARSAATMSGDGFTSLVSEAVEDFTIMFQATMDQIKDARDIAPGDKAKMMASLADSFNKMVNSAGKASPQLSKLGVATEVLKKLADFIRANFPHHGEAFIEILEPFGQSIAQDYAQ